MSAHVRSAVARRTKGAPPAAGERVIPVILSTGDVDSDGEVIDQASWRLERFLANPIALYQHDRTCEPIGFYRRVRVESDALKAGLVLYDDETSPEAKLVWNRYQQGGPVAFSVGLACPRAAAEEREGRPVRVLYDCELEEASVVSIPANPNAIAEARAKGAALYRRHRAAQAHHPRKKTPMNPFQKLLADKGMTMEEFAAKAGLSMDECKALAEGAATDEQKQKAADAFEMSLDDMLDVLTGEDEEDVVPPVVDPAAKSKKTPARRAKTASGSFVEMLGAKDEADAKVKLQALIDAREEHRELSTRVKSLEANVRKSSEAGEAAARERVLEKYRGLGVLTKAREAGKVGAQLAKYKSAAEVESYLDTLDPVADATPAARQAEVGTAPDGVTEKHLKEVSAETGIPVEKLKKSAQSLAERPLIR